MAAALLQHLRCFLVEHPTISSFHWQPRHTSASSPSFIASAVSLYLLAVLLLHRRLVPLPSLPPRLLRAVSAFHNVSLLMLSAAMAVGCSLSAAAQAPSSQWLFCFPPDSTPPSGPVFFWAHVFYLSKLYEFGDTFLILLGGRPLTLLHVYHHAVVIVMCYLWLATQQSLMLIGLVTNATVHVVMYGYYLSCSVGWRWPPRWKRVVTELQIVQFLFSFAASAVLLWLHFSGDGCKGMLGWVFNAVFNASLLVLFLNFHGAAYAEGKNKKGKAE